MQTRQSENTLKACQILFILLIAAFFVWMNPFKGILFPLVLFPVVFLFFMPKLTLYLLVFAFPLLPQELDIEVYGISLKIPDVIAIIGVLSFGANAIFRKYQIVKSPIMKHFIFFLSAIFLSTLFNRIYPSQISGLRLIREGSTGLNTPGIIDIKTLLWACYSFGIFLMIVNLITSKDTLVKVTKILFWATAFCCLIGIFGMLTYFLGFGSSIGIRVSQGIVQAKGTLREPSYLGEYIAMLLPLPLSLFLVRSSEFSYRFILFILLSIVIALILTFSATGYATVMPGIFVVFALAFFQSRQPIKQIKQIVLIFVLLMLTIVIFAFWYPGFVERAIYVLVKPTVLRDESTYLRFQANLISFRTFLRYPLYGIGPGNSPFYVYQLGRGISSYLAFMTPGVLSQTLSETGLIGIVAFFSIFMSFFINLFRAQKTTNDDFLKALLIGFIGTFVVMLVSFYASPNIFRVYLWGLMGIAASVITIASADEQTVQRQPQPNTQIDS